jgi:hypothetical protein
MLLELASSVVTGVLSGGATGLIGLAVQQWGEASKRKSDLEVLRENNKLTLQLSAQEAAHKLETAKVDAASAERLAELEAMARADSNASSDYRAAVKSDKATYLDKGAQAKSRFATWLMAIVDFCRGMTRPGVTWYATVLQGYLVYWLMDMISRSSISMTSDLQNKLVSEIIGTTSYIVTTSIVFWFGGRPIGRK